MTDYNTLAIVAYGLQFTILLFYIYILKGRIERIEKAKCRCCGGEHPLLDPVNP